MTKLAFPWPQRSSIAFSLESAAMLAYSVLQSGKVERVLHWKKTPCMKLLYSLDTKHMCFDEQAGGHCMRSSRKHKQSLFFPPGKCAALQIELLPCTNAWLSWKGPTCMACLWRPCKPSKLHDHLGWCRQNWVGCKWGIHV